MFLVEAGNSADRDNRGYDRCVCPLPEKGNKYCAAGERKNQGFLNSLSSKRAKPIFPSSRTHCFRTISAGGTLLMNGNPRVARQVRAESHQRACSSVLQFHRHLSPVPGFPCSRLRLALDYHSCPCPLCAFTSPRICCALLRNCLFARRKASPTAK